MVRKNTNKEKNSLPINVIGVSAAGVVDLPSEKQKLIISAKNLSGPKRILDEFKDWWRTKGIEKPLPKLFPSDKPKVLIDWLKKQTDQTVLLASGDPLWFGIGRLLLDHFPPERIIFHSSPTSLQLAFSRIGIPWQDADWISIHGREISPLLNLLQRRPNIIGILVDPNEGGAKEVRELLRANDLEKQYDFWIFERLGHKKEQIFQIFPNQVIPNLDPLHLVILIKRKEAFTTKTDLPLFGLPDDSYIQYKDRPGLLTKREIRIQVLADLELPKNGVIWDIGAGVGSIGLEALRIRPSLKLLSIDKRVGGEKLINANAKRLSVNPEKIIEGEAIEFLKSGSIPNNLLRPNRVILGGGSHDKTSLLNEIFNHLTAGGIVVVPIATLEHLEKITNLLKKRKCDLKISQHINFRGIPLNQGTRLFPMNPIFIVRGQLK